MVSLFTKHMLPDIRKLYFAIQFYKLESIKFQPERLESSSREYDIRADVWSVGISLIELAKGEYPYKGCSSEFEVLSRIVSDPPPVLTPEEGFTPLFCDFVRLCLVKDYLLRPKYNELLVSSYPSFFFRY